MEKIIKVYNRKNATYYTVRVLCNISSGHGIVGAYGYSQYDVNWSGTDTTSPAYYETTDTMAIEIYNVSGYNISYVENVQNCTNISSLHDLSGGNGKYATFNITGNARIRVAYVEKPTPTRYTVSTSVTPSGSGTVSGGGTYNKGTSITLTAHPSSGYEFDYWTDGSGEYWGTNISINYTVNASITFIAHFKQIPSYRIDTQVTPPEGGSISGGGTYQRGTVITIRAYPNDGWELEYFTDGDGEIWSYDTSFTYTVTQSKTFIAHYKRIVTYTINTNVSPSEYPCGTVTGGGTYRSGTQITLQAIPDALWEFVKFVDDRGYTYTDSTINLTVTDNRTYTAYFRHTEIVTVNLLLIPTQTGLATLIGGGAYHKYEDVVIKCEDIAIGYEFDGWYHLSDNLYTLISHNNPYVINNIAGSTTIYCILQGDCILHVATNPAGVIADVSPDMNVVRGGTYTIYARTKNNSLWKFHNWYDGDTNNEKEVTIPSLPQRKYVYTANYVKKKIWTIHMSVVPSGSECGYTIEGYGASYSTDVYVVEEDHTIRLNAYTNNSIDFIFDGWYINDSETPYSTMEHIDYYLHELITDEDIYIKAVFKAIDPDKVFNVGIVFTPMKVLGIGSAQVLVYRKSLYPNMPDLVEFIYPQEETYKIYPLTNDYVLEVRARQEPGSEYLFVNFTGNLVNTSSISTLYHTITTHRFLYEDTILFINYSRDTLTYRMKVLPGGGGVIENFTGREIEIIGTERIYEQVKGTEIFARATPNEGHNFLRWELSTNPITIIESTDIHITLTEETAVSIYAIFDGEAEMYTIGVFPNPLEGGHVSGGGRYNAGARYTITAEANEGWIFKGWNTGLKQSSVSYYAHEDKTYIAYFEKKPTPDPPTPTPGYIPKWLLAFVNRHKRKHSVIIK